ncbi:MAG: hypothetical protein RBR50_04375 [Candidatus Izemoplasmatales bacterium]|nr:hypothetical protein [Candidatus Izemoplasmatales bacterium]
MKIFVLIGSLALLLFFSGCAEYLNTLANNMKDMQNKEALAQTEDLEMSKLFIDKLPDSRVSKSQITMKNTLDLGKQTTNTNNWVYNPIGYFERNMDKDTKAYTLWINTVKNRGGIVKKYNANVSREINNFIYLNKLQPYERYHASLAPAYIEYDKNGNMISSYVRILKTEDLSAVGGIVVQGKRPYQAFSYDVIVLKTYLRKLQMNASRKFFEENLLDENIIASVKSSEEELKPLSLNNDNTNKIDINKVMLDKFNVQNGTNFTSLDELQKYLSSQAN